MTSKQEHLSLLAEVAMLYYEKRMKQSEIAAILDVSSSTVSRFLDEALREKIVEITINYPWQSSIELSARLEERFHLETARVLIADYKDDAQMLEGLGALASRYLISVLREDTKIGVSGGNTVYHTIRTLQIEPSAQRGIIQLGGVGNAEDSPLNAAGLVQLLAEAIGGVCHYLYVPMIVESNTVRNALMLEPHVRDTLELAEQADITLISIGAPGPELGQLNPAYPSAPASVDKLEPGYIVGAINGQVFDVNGTVLDVDINKRVIGLELNSLIENKRVVAVAGGEPKALAILGALRGGFVDVMITDEKAARMILEVDRQINTF
jgi:DNA-binding transcriptional regulator LsrR (DeoR family)